MPLPSPHGARSSRPSCRQQSAQASPPRPVVQSSPASHHTPGGVAIESREGPWLPDAPKPPKPGRSPSICRTTQYQQQLGPVYISPTSYPVSSPCLSLASQSQPNNSPIRRLAVRLESITAQSPHYHIAASLATLLLAQLAAQASHTAAHYAVLTPDKTHHHRRLQTNIQLHPLTIHTTVTKTSSLRTSIGRARLSPSHTTRSMVTLPLRNPRPWLPLM